MGPCARSGVRCRFHTD